MRSQLLAAIVLLVATPVLAARGRTPGPDLVVKISGATGAAVDAGCYEMQLLECGDGGIDPGEECGEPGLGACADPCTACSGCTCAPAPVVCGDGAVCGAEACEDDTDCAGEGVRVVIDGTSGPGGLDVTVPGGAGWKTNAAGTRWRYSDGGEGKGGGLDPAAGRLGDARHARDGHGLREPRVERARGSAAALRGRRRAAHLPLSARSHTARRRGHPGLSRGRCGSPRTPPGRATRSGCRGRW